MNHGFRSSVKVFLVVLLLFSAFSALQATQFRLFRTPRTGNTVRLTAPAMIVSIQRNTDRYTIWRNGQAYLTINLPEDPVGVLPPGNYTLRANPGGSVAINLNTAFKPRNLQLWGETRVLVKPLWHGNYIILASPAPITSETYTGTNAMGIYGGKTRVLYYIGPNNRPAKGPRVIGGTGGRTLVGQVLSPGIYRLVPIRGHADGIVYGEVKLTVK
jgi:hypothetical protein